MAKSPAQRGVSVQQLHTDYKAPEFLAALKLFLNSRLPRDKVVSPMESDQFNVFNQLYVKIKPSVVTGHDSSWQKIRAKPKVAACGRKAGSPPDLILCLCGTKDTSREFFGGLIVSTQPHRRRKCALTRISLQEMRIAQVRVIFKLPDHLGHYPHPLAYVEWFTSLRRHDPISGQFIVSHSMWNHQRNVLVISADRFTCPCHLQAQCGRNISSDWTANNMLETASAFHVNSYIDLDTFVALSH